VVYSPFSSILSFLGTATQHANAVIGRHIRDFVKRFNRKKHVQQQQQHRQMHKKLKNI
jgi:hypothetical protein